MDHRAGYSKNPLNNPPRRVKKAGVGETEDQKGGKKRGVHRVHGTRRLIPSKDGQGYSGTTKALGKIKEDFVVNEEQKPLPMDKMRKQSDKHFKNIKTELGRARNSMIRQKLPLMYVVLDEISLIRTQERIKWRIWSKEGTQLTI